MGFLDWMRGFNTRSYRAGGLTPLQLPTTKECPKCGHKLVQNNEFVQVYVCNNCGYTGPIGLVPENSDARKSKNVGRRKN
jgi:predicted RNA-binding Zn-ribbon protein involved in translation (DUF1610 family)